MPKSGYFYDNTRLKDHRNCNRFFFLRHRLGWSIPGASLPLAFGGSWHEAMDSVWKQVCFDNEVDQRKIIDKAYEAFLEEWTQRYKLPLDEDLNPDQLEKNLPRTNGVALNMILEYVVNRWEFLNSIVLLEIEKPFAVPMPNNSEVFYVGRLDKIFKYQGDIWVGEHKTSSMYKKNGPFRTDFIDSFSPNSQVDGYIYSASMHIGERVRGCMVDAALVHKTVHDGFQFIPIIRPDSAIDSWLYEAEMEISDILKSDKVIAEAEQTGLIRKKNHLPDFRKNSENCMGKYGPCQFLGVCKATDNVIKDFPQGPPVDLEERFWEPFDFYQLEKMGFENAEESS